MPRNPSLLDCVPVTEGDTLPVRPVQAFRELLEEEGLIPVKPLTGDELLDAWPKAYTVISHYHEFFRSFVPLISDAIGGEPTAGRTNAILVFSC
jgi:hypothetical protein